MKRNGIYLFFLMFNLSMAQDFKVSKEEIRNSLLLLKKEGRISDADFKKAVVELDQMDNKKVDELNARAENIISNQPEKVNQMLNSSK